jgi:FkbM family methyltransferase
MPFNRINRYILNTIKNLFRIYTRYYFLLLGNKCSTKLHGHSFFTIKNSYFYMQYKDIFLREIYAFESTRNRPLIIDCGSNIGVSVVYFKLKYPHAKLIGFEPDPEIFKVLTTNVNEFHFKDVFLINSAIGSHSGTINFKQDGGVGGQVSESAEDGINVKVETLSPYLNEQVDFLKLNIEGEEFGVLQEITTQGKIRNISEMVIEYHGWANGQQLLGNILQLLNMNGFRYLVHDFDEETCKTSKPPFKIRPNSSWFCLIYAKRDDLVQQ